MARSPTRRHAIVIGSGLGGLTAGAVLAGIAWAMLQGANVASHHGSAAEKDHMAEIEETPF